MLYHSDRDLPEALACVNAALRFNPKWRTGYALRQRDIRAKLKTVRLLLAMLHHRRELEKFQHPEEALEYLVEAAERDPDPIFAGPIYDARRIAASAAPPPKPGPPHHAPNPKHLQSARVPTASVPPVAGHRIVLGIPGVLSIGAATAGSPFSAPKAAPRKEKG